MLTLLMLACSGSVLACTATVAPLVFGSIDPLHGGDSDSATSIAIDCDGAMPYSIALSTGGGMALERVMYSGDDTLSYNLYTDPGHTLIWGDGSAGTVIVTGSDPGTGSDHTIYGVIPAQSQAVPGAYGDSIVVTISY